MSRAFAEAHDLGMFTVLWCYLRNDAFKKDGVDYAVAADLTGQANHMGVTIEADIIKQKLPENNGGFDAIGFGKTSPLVYDELTTDHPIDLCRWQIANCYMGRIGLINSGGASSGASDLAEAVRTAVINKRAGGLGLISGRKAFQRPTNEGVELLNAIHIGGFKLGFWFAQQGSIVVFVILIFVYAARMRVIRTSPTVSSTPISTPPARRSPP